MKMNDPRGWNIKEKYEGFCLENIPELSERANALFSRKKENLLIK